MALIKFITSFSCLTILLGAVMAIDYCSLQGCHDRHIACRNNGSFGIDCPADSKMVDMAPHREMILRMFNEIRNQVAGGHIEPFPIASRMAHMKWSPELEYLAELNAKTCRNQYDKCRGTRAFPYAGQNIAMHSYTGEESSYLDDELIKERIEEWLDQYQFTSPEIIHSFPAEVPNPPVGDFTVAVNAKNSDIGCAAIRYTLDFYNHFAFVCNFSQGNLVGQPVYEVGDTPASECRNRYGASVEYPNLCHPKEVYSYELIPN